MKTFVSFLAFTSLVAMSLVMGACETSDSLAELDLTGKTEQQIVLIKRGKAVYSSTCIACHNSDPKVDGSIGPAVAGSSEELLHLKVTTNKYPAGYKPKRETTQMITQPQFAADIPALFQYLNALK